MGGHNQYDSYDKNSGIAAQASFALWGPSGSVWAVYG